MNSSYQEIFQITKERKQTSIVSEKVLEEEDEENLSDSEFHNSKEEMKIDNENSQQHHMDNWRNLTHN